LKIPAASGKLIHGVFCSMICYENIFELSRMSEENTAISKDIILISCNSNLIGEATALFVAPVEAKEQQGLIQMWSVAKGQQGKHILHTLAQRAMFDFEERALITEWQAEGAKLTSVDAKMEVSIIKGLVLMVDTENHIKLFAHKEVDIMPMLRAIQRYATRMIRLDVR
jgi:hypothetical protein